MLRVHFKKNTNQPSFTRRCPVLFYSQNNYPGIAQVLFNFFFMESNQDKLYCMLNAKRLGLTFIANVVMVKTFLFPPNVAHACWFNLLKILFLDHFITCTTYSLAIVAKQDHFPCDKSVLFMLYSLFSLYMKEPFTYFRIYIYVERIEFFDPQN